MKIGDRVVIKGPIEYFQDHSFWSADFGEHGKVFEISDRANTDRFWCKRYGYGLLGTGDGKAYGNGRIAIHKKYLRLL